MNRLILILIITGVIIIAYTIGLAVYFGKAHGQDAARWYLIKIYANGYHEETACMLDLQQAAQMSPKGTRFKCERVIP